MSSSNLNELKQNFNSSKNNNIYYKINYNKEPSSINRKKEYESLKKFNFRNFHFKIFKKNYKKEKYSKEEIFSEIIKQIPYLCIKDNCIFIYKTVNKSHLESILSIGLDPNSNKDHGAVGSIDNSNYDSNNNMIENFKNFDVGKQFFSAFLFNALTYRKIIGNPITLLFKIPLEFTKNNDFVIINNLIEIVTSSTIPPEYIYIILDKNQELIKNNIQKINIYQSSPYLDNNIINELPNYFVSINPKLLNKNKKIKEFEDYYIINLKKYIEHKNLIKDNDFQDILNIQNSNPKKKIKKL